MNRPHTSPGFPDDAADDDIPDLSAPDWQTQFAKAPVMRGRPPSPSPKVSTTIRLDPDVVEWFKAGGAGWQSRMNMALRKAAGLD